MVKCFEIIALAEQDQPACKKKFLWIIHELCFALRVNLNFELNVLAAQVLCLIFGPHNQVFCCLYLRINYIV